MDLLASYSDDADSGKNTPILDQMPPKIDSSKSGMSLEAEWESFEKMIGGAGFADSSGPPPLPVAAPQMPVLTENMNLILSEPPNLTTVETPPNRCNNVDPPVLSNMTEPPNLTNTASTLNDSSSARNKNPPKLTDVMLSSEFHSENLFGEPGNDEMPTLTKMTGSPTSSPEHSSSRSSSSGSRSSSVESVKSTEKRRSPSPVSRKKSASPSKPSSSSSLRKDEKRGKRSRTRSRSRSRSPHRKRRRSSDRKRSRSRSRERRRPSDRRRRSRSRGKKRRRSSSQSRRKRRSRSRGRHRSSRDRRSSRERHKRKEESHRRDRSRDRSKERHRRSRSRDRSRDRSKERHRRSHSRERRRSRSGSPIRGRERFSRPVGSKTDKKPLTFKEQMRQQLLKASKILSEQGEGSELKDLELPKEKPSNLPLNATNMFSAATSGSSVTPQMALLQTMAAMHQKAQEMTGVAVPKYYNPAAVNPLKYAEQVQKRKLLWSKNKDKKEEDSQWQSTAFVSDQDGKMAAKFRKLMGMKEDGTECQTEEEKAHVTEEQKKKTEEMFYRLDKEYEFARMTTHTHRGVGLGFSSQGFPTQGFPNP